MRFYAALHLLQAYLLSKHHRFEARRHNDRWKAIRDSPELKQNFHRAYRRLQDVSEQIRYEAGFVPRAEDYQNTRADLGVVRSFLTSKVDRILAGASE